MIKVKKNKKKKKEKKRKNNDHPLELKDSIQDDDTAQKEEKAEEEENIDLSPMVYYNIIIEMRKLLKKRYELMEKYKFNASKFFRGLDKPKYKENIKKCLPSFDEEVKEQMIAKIDDGKMIKGKELSQTWLFNET